jgi:hypothetical protein
VLLSSAKRNQQKSQLCAGPFTSLPDSVLHARNVLSPDPAAIQINV